MQLSLKDLIGEATLLGEPPGPPSEASFLEADRDFERRLEQADRAAAAPRELPRD